MIEPYKKRHFKSLTNWKIKDLIIKPYSISKDNKVINKDVMDKALAYTQEIIPTMLKDHDHNSAGYVIVHKGDMGIWLLVHVWGYDDIALSALGFAVSEQHDFVCYDNKPFHACVWDHVVINHERNAWVNHVLTANCSITNYSVDKLEDGEY